MIPSTSHPSTPFRVVATITTVSGRTGVQDLAANPSAMEWDRAIAGGEDRTVVAQFRLIRDGLIVDSFEVDGAAWRQFEDEADMRGFLDDCRTGTLSAALRAQLDVFENHYEHEECGTSWTDTHSCGCDDECPTCGAAISPHESIQLEGLADEQPGQPARFLVAASSAERAPAPQRPGKAG